MTPFTVSAFYHFTRFDDPASLRAPLFAALSAHNLRGTVLLAPEGVNGTLAGTRAGIDAAMAALRALPGCAALEHKESTAAEMPFYRLKVRLKKEIVTLGVPGVDPTVEVGAYVDPEDWNALIEDPDTVVIDTRNNYEVGIGTFKGAINPETETFRDFPSWLADHREELAGKKIAMFCTGGIRCEKATAYMVHEGFGEVFHLKGGILKYLETVSEEESCWEGDCFVFDERVAVGHGLRQGDYIQCRACRRPLGEAERTSPKYVPGVSCEHCADERNEEQRRRYADRQHQVEIAEARGQPHIGAVYPKSAKFGAARNK